MYDLLADFLAAHYSQLTGIEVTGYEAGANYILVNYNYDGFRRKEAEMIGFADLLAFTYSKINK